MTPALAFESDRSPDEVIDALRSASRATMTSIGGSGVRARVLPGRRIRLSHTGGIGHLRSSRFVGRVTPDAGGSRIEGTFRSGVVTALVERLFPAPTTGADVIRRHLEIVCEARPVDPRSA